MTEARECELTFVVCFFSGSISAEHGLGLMKATKIGYSKSPTSIEYMKKIKEVFDPKGILSPYKVSVRALGFKTQLQPY